MPWDGMYVLEEVSIGDIHTHVHNACVCDCVCMCA